MYDSGDSIKEHIKFQWFSLFFPSASPSVTNFEPRRNLTVPVTLSRNVTFVCTVDASGTTIPIWEVAISQYPNNQLPLTGRELQGGFISTAFEMLGIVTKDINLQNSTLDVTEAARRNNTLIQVQCNAFDIAEASCASPWKLFYCNLLHYYLWYGHAGKINFFVSASMPRAHSLLYCGKAN